MRFKTNVARRKVAAEFVMSAPELALLPGLFRDISSADQRRWVPLRVEYQHGQGKLINVTGGYLLSGFDLAVLQALELVAVGANGRIASDDELGTGLRDKLTVELDPGVELSYARCSVSHLLQLVGMPCSADYIAAVEASLGRLFGVTLSVAMDASKPNRCEHYHLLSHAHTGECRRTHELHVALNPLLTQALTGASAQDVRLRAAELKVLGTDHAARILHQRLCATVNDGGKGRFSASTLYGYVYPDDDAEQVLALLRQRTERGDYQAVRRQQQALSAGMETLVALGWELTFVKGKTEDLVVVSRPKVDWTYEALAARKAEAKAARLVAAV